jgi:hypothetical protein
MLMNNSNIQNGREQAMLSEWLAAEDYRIHVMELWPDGPRKQAGLAAARSALRSLARTVSKGSTLLIRPRSF